MLELTQSDRDKLSGREGEALRFAMEVVVEAAGIMGAQCLQDVSFVHVDACHYYGRAHLDFAQYLLDRGARFAIPAWTNTVPVSLIQQEIRDQADLRSLEEARHLTRQYVELGCAPVWTCAPYQLPDGPGFGDHIVVGESNAVSFYNTVVGARTNKYSDFLDVCAGLAGRVPMAGLHLDEGRRASMGFTLNEVPDEIRYSELFCQVLGIVVGQLSGLSVPFLRGLPVDTHRDSLKGLCAAAASSGGVCMIQVEGVTPEAMDQEQASQGVPLGKWIDIKPDWLIQARNMLSESCDGSLSMVALGTPHFSVDEFARVMNQIDGNRVHPETRFYISTSRYVADIVKANGWWEQLRSAGVQVLVDTCTYFAPAVQGARGTVMTNSAKWAYYAPGMLPVDVAFGALEDCVASAIAGRVIRQGW